MSVDAMLKLRDKLCEELDEMALNGKMTLADLGTLHTLTDTIKNLDKIQMLEDGEGYSSGDEWETRLRRHDYDHGASYSSNRGKHYVSGHYSRSGDYDLPSRLRELMRGDLDDRQKDILKMCLDELER